MEKKPSKSPDAAPKGASGASAAAPRHRFNESSDRTTVMPLAEILRRAQGSGDAPAQESPFAESTKLSLNPFLESKPAPPPPVSRPSEETQRSAKPARAAAPAAVPANHAPPAVSPSARPVKVPAAAPVAVKPAAAAPQTSTAELKKAATPRPHQVMVFFSCKGGSGSTVLSCNAAHTYAHKGLRTALIDLDLQLGDVLAALSLQPRASLARGVEMAGRGEALTPALLPQHRSGVAVVSQVGSLDDMDKVNSEGVAKVIERMRGPFEMVLVDGVRDFSDNVLAVLDVADKVALVVVQEVLAIRRARWAFGILRKIGFDPRDVTVVVNRFAPNHEISLATLGQMFAQATLLPVGRDEGLVQQSLDRGTPLSELNARHPVTKNIADLSAILNGEALPPPPAPAVSEAKKDKKEATQRLGEKLMFWRKT